MAGKDWFYGLLKCQPHLPVRTPQNTRLSQAARFNRPQVGECFSIFRKRKPYWLYSSVRHDTESPTEQVKGIRQEDQSRNLIAIGQLITFIHSFNFSNTLSWVRLCWNWRLSGEHQVQGRNVPYNGGNWCTQDSLQIQTGHQSIS